MFRRIALAILTLSFVGQTTCIADGLVSVRLFDGVFRAPNTPPYEGPRFWPVDDGFVFPGSDADGNDFFFTDGIELTRFNINVSGDANSRYFAPFDGYVYFLAEDPNREMYRTNGHSFEHVDLATNPFGEDYPTLMIPFENKLYFGANNGDSRIEVSRQLFAFDGQRTTAVDVFWPSGFDIAYGDLYLRTHADTDDESLYVIEAGQEPKSIHSVPDFVTEGVTSFSLHEWNGYGINVRNNGFLATNGIETQFISTHDVDVDRLFTVHPDGDALFFLGRDGEGVGFYSMSDDLNVTLLGRFGRINEIVEFKDGLIIDEGFPAEKRLHFVSQDAIREINLGDHVRSFNMRDIFDGYAYIGTATKDGAIQLVRTDGESVEQVYAGSARLKTLGDHAIVTPVDGGNAFAIKASGPIEYPPYENSFNRIRIGSIEYHLGADGLYMTARSDDPARADFNRNGMLDAGDIDMLSEFIAADEFRAALDLDLDQSLTKSDREMWVTDFAKTYFGDSNLDGVFNSRDLVQVFTMDEFEDGIPTNSTWTSGDWNGDREFDSRDLVLAFQFGGYDLGPRTQGMAVPESTCFAVWLSLFALRFRQKK